MVACEKGLQKIFGFYSGQQLLTNKKATFDTLRSEFNTLSLSEFMKFCSDFAIPLPPAKLQELFYKTAKQFKDLNFDFFAVDFATTNV